MEAVVVSFDRDILVEALARALKPLWFDTLQDPERGEYCVLDNYPGQHLKYQAAARAEANELVERLKR